MWQKTGRVWRPGQGHRRVLPRGLAHCERRRIGLAGRKGALLRCHRTDLSSFGPTATPFPARPRGWAMAARNRKTNLNFIPVIFPGTLYPHNQILDPQDSPGFRAPGFRKFCFQGLMLQRLGLDGFKVTVHSLRDRPEVSPRRVHHLDCRVSLQACPPNQTMRVQVRVKGSQALGYSAQGSSVRCGKLSKILLMIETLQHPIYTILPEFLWFSRSWRIYVII